MASRRAGSRNAAVASNSMSIPRSLGHLVEVSARTAVEGAGDIAVQLRQLAWDAARAIGSASVAIASDVVDVTRRTAVGTGQGIWELGQEVVQLRTARPRAGVRGRAPRPSANRHRRSGRGTAAVGLPKPRAIPEDVTKT